MPSAMTTTSRTFVTTRIVRLLDLSASCPAYPENSMNGRMKSAPDERQRAAVCTWRGGPDREHRHDDLEQVVVDRAQELRPEERLKPRLPKRVAIAAHTGSSCGGSDVRPRRPRHLYPEVKAARKTVTEQR